MKTTQQIAKATGCTYDAVYRAVLNNKLTPVSYEDKFRMYGQSQIDFIFKILYFGRKMNFITYESKLNDPNFDCPELYSRENFISAGNIIKK
jgi:hypothetical protein